MPKFEPKRPKIYKEIIDFLLLNFGLFIIEFSTLTYKHRVKFIWAYY